MRQFLIAMLATFSGMLHAYDVEVEGICYNLMGTRRATVTHRGDWSQSSTSYAGDIVIPEQFVYNGNTYSVTSVGENAFAGCDELTSVSLPSTIKALSACAFLGCTNLRQVTLPSTIQAIASCAFTGCTSLQQISLPRQAELVDTLTLYCCSSLKSLVLPHRIRLVCQGALEHLPSVTDLYAFSSAPPVAELGAFTLSDQTRCTLHVPAEALSLYQKSPVWSDFYRVVPLSDEDYLMHNYQRGDINANGRIDVEDLVLLQRIIVSLPTDATVRWAADVNGDGKVNAVDYVTLAKLL